MSLADVILKKIPMPTGLDSESIRTLLAAEIRQRAFFSARMMSVPYLKQLQQLCGDFAEGMINLATARWRAKQVFDALGLTRGAGGLADAGGTRRIELILKTQRQMAASVARIKLRTADELEDWPAWRLERYGSRHAPREDWPIRWKAAADAVAWEGVLKDPRGRMIALKTSPVWQALGNGAGGFRDTLGNPYPPFAFSSGLDWTDVSREECLRLGLALPPEGAYIAGDASLRGADEEIRRAMAQTGLTAEQLLGPNGMAMNRWTKRGGYPENTGWFSPGAGSREHKAKPAKRTIDPSKITPRENEAMGHAALRKIENMLKSGNASYRVEGAMYRKELGDICRIDFVVGWKGKGPFQEHGYGFEKIRQKHADVIPEIPKIIAYGDVLPSELTYLDKNKTRVFTGRENPNERRIVYLDYVLFLKKGKDSWTITSAYKSPKKERASREFAKKMALHSEGQ